MALENTLSPTDRLCFHLLVVLGLLAVTGCKEPDPDPDPDPISPSVCADADADGFSPFDAAACPSGLDCDDSDGATYPGAIELCDGADNDCDSQLPKGEYDRDADLFFDCEECDDSDENTYPGAIELCDGADNDCDGSAGTDEIDGDTDGFLACNDCDDTDNTTYLGATEICDGADNDCDGTPGTDEGDGDLDGFVACNDCDDANAAVWPGAQEICDGLDNNCVDGIDAADPAYAGDDSDGDGDPGIPCGGNDCNDGDASLSGLDLDLDSSSSCDGDCNDDDPYVRPGAIEGCDGVDTDCDGDIDTTDSGFVSDADGDGSVTSGCAQGGTDCDDRDPHVFPEDLYTSGVQVDCQPAVYPGFSHQWNFARISTPTYFLDPSSGQHYLYFRAHEDKEQQVIGYASSADGSTWSAPVGPIFSPNSDEWDHRNLSSPSVVHVPSASRPYLMAYHAQTPDSGLRQIGLATATAPEGPFERLSADTAVPLTAPALGAAPAGLDDDRVMSPSLRYDSTSDTLHLWYNGRSTTTGGTLRVFHATSIDHGVTWIRTDDDSDSEADVVFEPTEAWEGSKVTQVSWLSDPTDPGRFEYWYTGNEESIGHATGDETTWSRSSTLPALEASPTCSRFDGNGVTARGIRHDPATDTYSWYYGAQTDIDGVDCLGNDDSIYDNGSDTVSYVGQGSNSAPAVAVDAPTTPAASMTFTGEITDTAPDQVVVTLDSDIDGFLGTASVAPTGNTDPAIQTTSWSLAVTGLSPGTHDLFVTALDEAGISRESQATVTIP